MSIGIESRLLMHILSKQNESYIAHVEQALQKLSKEDRYSAEASIVEMLMLADQSLEKEALTFLEALDSSLAERIRESILKFEHVGLLDDRAVQKVLREIEMEPLAKALKGSSEDIQNKILRNMSQRAAGLLK